MTRSSITDKCRRDILNTTPCPHECIIGRYTFHLPHWVDGAVDAKVLIDILCAIPDDIFMEWRDWVRDQERYRCQTLRHADRRRVLSNIITEDIADCGRWVGAMVVMAVREEDLP